MKYHFKIHKEPRGYWAECLELKGCYTQADSEPELRKNMKTVLNLFLREPPDSKHVFPLPRKAMARGPGVVEVAVDPRVGFAFHLRQLRLKHGLTQAETAKRMGFRNLYSYQRLENAKTANPGLTTIVQVKEVFPELSLDDILAA